MASVAHEELLEVFAKMPRSLEQHTESDRAGLVAAMSSMDRPEKSLVECLDYVAEEPLEAADVMDIPSASHFRGMLQGAWMSTIVETLARGSGLGSVAWAVRRSRLLLGSEVTQEARRVSRGLEMWVSHLVAHLPTAEQVAVLGPLVAPGACAGGVVSARLLRVAGDVVQLVPQHTVSASVDRAILGLTETCLAGDTPLAIEQGLRAVVQLVGTSVVADNGAAASLAVGVCHALSTPSCQSLLGAARVAWGLEALVVLAEHRPHAMGPVAAECCAVLLPLMAGVHRHAHEVTHVRLACAWWLRLMRAHPAFCGTVCAGVGPAQAEPEAASSVWDTEELTEASSGEAEGVSQGEDSWAVGGSAQGGHMDPESMRWIDEYLVQVLLLVVHASEVISEPLFAASGAGGQQTAQERAQREALHGETLEVLGGVARCVGAACVVPNLVAYLHDSTAVAQQAAVVAAMVPGLVAAAGGVPRVPRQGCEAAQGQMRVLEAHLARHLVPAVLVGILDQETTAAARASMLGMLGVLLRWLPATVAPSMEQVASVALVTIETRAGGPRAMEAACELVSRVVGLRAGMDHASWAPMAVEIATILRGVLHDSEGRTLAVVLQTVGALAGDPAVALPTDLRADLAQTVWAWLESEHSGRADTVAVLAQLVAGAQGAAGGYAELGLAAPAEVLGWALGACGDAADAGPAADALWASTMYLVAALCGTGAVPATPAAVAGRLRTPAPSEAAVLARLAFLQRAPEVAGCPVWVLGRLCCVLEDAQALGAWAAVWLGAGLEVLHGVLPGLAEGGASEDAEVWAMLERVAGVVSGVLRDAVAVGDGAAAAAVANAYAAIGCTLGTSAVAAVGHLIGGDLECVLEGLALVPEHPELAAAVMACYGVMTACYGQQYAEAAATTLVPLFARCMRCEETAVVDNTVYALGEVFGALDKAETGASLLEYVAAPLGHVLVGTRSDSDSDRRSEGRVQRAAICVGQIMTVFRHALVPFAETLVPAFVGALPVVCADGASAALQRVAYEENVIALEALCTCLTWCYDGEPHSSSEEEEGGMYRAPRLALDRALADAVGDALCRTVQYCRLSSSLCPSSLDEVCEQLCHVTDGLDARLFDRLSQEWHYAPSP